MPLDPSQVYVTKCDAKFSTHAEGHDHEKHCPECRGEIGEITESELDPQQVILNEMSWVQRETEESIAREFPKLAGVYVSTTCRLTNAGQENCRVEWQVASSHNLFAFGPGRNRCILAYGDRDNVADKLVASVRTALASCRQQAEAVAQSVSQEGAL